MDDRLNGHSPCGDDLGRLGIAQILESQTYREGLLEGGGWGAKGLSPDCPETGKKRRQKWGFLSRTGQPGLSALVWLLLNFNPIRVLVLEEDRDSHCVYTNWSSGTGVDQALCKTLRGAQTGQANSKQDLSHNNGVPGQHMVYCQIRDAAGFKRGSGMWVLRSERPREDQL